MIFSKKLLKDSLTYQIVKCNNHYKKIGNNYSLLEVKKNSRFSMINLIGSSM